MKPEVIFTRPLILLVFCSCMLFSNGQYRTEDQLIQSITIPRGEKDSSQVFSGEAPIVKHVEKGSGQSNSKISDKTISTMLPSVEGEGMNADTCSAISRKTSISNPYVKGSKALSVVIYDAWWNNAYDADGDGYVQSATLNWDADVAGGTGSLKVYMMLYYKPGSGGDWTLVTTTASYTITDNSVSDAYHVNLHNISHGLYD